MKKRRKRGGSIYRRVSILPFSLIQSQEGLGTLDEVVLSRPLTETPSIVEHLEDRGLHSAVGIIDVNVRVDHVHIYRVVLAFKHVSLREVVLEGREVAL